MPYCQHCGAKLEDGQTCTCEMAQAAANQQPQQSTISATPSMGETVTVQSAFDEIKKMMAQEDISGFKELYEKAIEQFYNRCTKSRIFKGSIVKV